MDGNTGVTLINPADLNFNINSQQEDEEDIEEEIRRKEMLNAQLEHAFDDWSESEHEEDSVHSSSSDDDHGSRKNSRRTQHSNGIVFRKLSSISERSPNKTGSSENSGLKSIFVFSPPGGPPHKSAQTNGDSFPLMDGRGDESPQFQAVRKNKLAEERNEEFQPIFSNNSYNDKSQISNYESGETFPQKGSNGLVINGLYEAVFKSEILTKNGDKFQHSFTNNSHSDLQLSVDETSDAYRQAEYNSVDQLRVLYDVRMREIQELQAENLRAANHQQEMLRQLALMEAEKQRAILSRTEANKLLVECKEEIVKLQKEVETQKKTIATLEEDRAKGDDAAEMLRVHIQELEQKVELMERFDANKTAAKQTQSIMKELKLKHQQEVSLMQREVDSLSKRLSKKEEDCRELEHRASGLQRSQEILLLEKTETINQLAHRLEESQQQCGQLMSSNVTVENVRLQNQLSEALREKDHLSQTVKNLQAECSIIRSDLTLYEGLARFTQPQSQSSSDETDSIVQMGISTRQKRNNPNTSDMVAKLKDELHRALLNQKAKRSEIQRLQELVNDKDKQIFELVEQERIHLSNIETVNEQLNNMMTEIQSLKNQKENENNSNDKSKSEEALRLNAQIAELRKENAVLEREKIEIIKKLDDLTKRFEEEKKREISNHNKEYLKFHDEIVAKVKKQMEEESQFKIKEYSVRLEQSLKEVSEVKEMYVAVCAAKDEVFRQLEDTRAQLQLVTGERDQLTLELEESRRLGDQLAQRVNEAAVISGGRSGGEIDEERERLRKELREYVEMRDHLARRVNIAERENAKLLAEVDKLKNELENKLLTNLENQVCAECGRLQEELTGMSARHTQELTSARTELQAARDRLLQLEKCARQQFDTEIKNLRQDRDSYKAKCDEKEAQIKKLIESRKRAPATVSNSTQTEVEGGGFEVLEKRLREEYKSNLSMIEKAHQDVVLTLRSRNKEEIDRLKQEYQKLLDAVKQQETQLRAAHQSELRTVEERTKQLTLEFCAAQIKRMEERYIEEARRYADPGLLQEKTAETENLKQRLAEVTDEHQQQIEMLRHQIEVDKDRTSQMMIQWAQELQNIQGELKLKEAIIDDQRCQIQKARAKVEKLRNQLITTNQKIETEYTSKCNQYKADFCKMVEEQEKLINEKVKQLEQAYESKVKELKKEMRKRKHNT